MAVYRCPRCELVFAYKGEVEWHLREDHQGERTDSPELVVS